MKNFIRVAFAATFTCMAGYGVYSSQQETELSELALANIEALAQNEGSDVDCPNNGNGCYNGLWYPCKREVYN